MSYYDNAKTIREYIDIATKHLDDEVAVTVTPLFTKWESGVAYAADVRVQHNAVLYKCVQPHTSQDAWTPDVTPALWIAVSAEAGTQDKPVTAVRGMGYEEGKYYLDTEDNNIYLCTRSAILQYMPHELVGHYFTLVE